MLSVSSLSVHSEAVCSEVRSPSVGGMRGCVGSWRSWRLVSEADVQEGLNEPMRYEVCDVTRGQTQSVSNNI